MTHPRTLPLSLPVGTSSKRRGVVAAGVVVLDPAHGVHPDGYLGNWQPVRITKNNPKREGWSWIPAWAIDWEDTK